MKVVYPVALTFSCQFDTFWGQQFQFFVAYVILFSFSIEFLISGV